MVKRILFLILPPFLYITFVYAVMKFFGYYIAGFLVAYFLPPAGKESVVPLMVTYLKDGLYGVTVTVLLITATDAFTAFFVIWNFDIILLIPKVGKLILKLEEKARAFIREYELSKNTYFGLFVFVFIPFQGTGSTTASLIGRLLGLDKLKLFLTITSASFTSSLFIALISIYLSERFKDYTVLIVVGLVVLLGLIARSIRKYRIHRRILHEAQRRVFRSSKGNGR